jgi:hypothetical protein
MNEQPTQLDYETPVPKGRSKLTHSSTWVTLLLVGFALLALMLLLMAPIIFAIRIAK